MKLNTDDVWTDIRHGMKIADIATKYSVAMNTVSSFMKRHLMTDLYKTHRRAEKAKKDIEKYGF